MADADETTDRPTGASETTTASTAAGASRRSRACIAA